jgi:hypothetical protein
MRKRALLPLSLCFIFLLSAAAVFAKGAQDEPDVPQERTVSVTGRVRVVGTGARPELLISDEARDWHIDEAPDKTALWDFQQQTITVSGTESYTDMTSANGLPAGRRYRLRDITILKSAAAEE